MRERHRPRDSQLRGRQIVVQLAKKGKKLKHKQRGGAGWELGLLIAVSKVPISIDDTRVSSKTKRRHTRRLGRPSLSAYPEELMGGP